MSERKNRLIRRDARRAHAFYDDFWSMAKPAWWRIRERRTWKRGRPAYNEVEKVVKRNARRRRMI